MYNHIQHKAVVAIQQLNIAPQRALWEDLWCRPLDKPSHTFHTKRHNRAYSCCDHMNTRHQGFYACAIDAYCRIAVLSSSRSRWQMLHIE